MLERHDDIDLRPIDFAALLPKLELTIGQVAKLSGLTIRQVSYWTNKGILAASNPKKRIYRADALEKAIYLKQCLDQGLTLNDAVVVTERYLAARKATINGRSRPPADPAGVAARPRPSEVAPFLMDRLGELRARAAEIRRTLPTIEARAELDLARTQLDVIAFFERNPYARDTAPRIAQQIGRPPELVRLALDALAARRGVRRVERPGYGERASSVGGER